MTFMHLHCVSNEGHKAPCLTHATEPLSRHNSQAAQALARLSRWRALPGNQRVGWFAYAIIMSSSEFEVNLT